MCIRDRLAYIPATEPIRSLDKVFSALLSFFIASGTGSLALAQGGDFLGGVNGTNATVKSVRLLRKCMNSFICSVDRPFTFIGRMNEDVNTYSRRASTGLLFLTSNQVSLGQTQTQATPGGMSDMYREFGTYVKSFYTVMYHPSSATVQMMNSAHARLHHQVRWRNTVPKILSEDLKQ